MKHPLITARLRAQGSLAAEQAILTAEEDVAMDRRTFVLATAAGLVAVPAQAAIPRLSGYTTFLGNRTGSATDVPTGIRLRGGAYDDFASGVRLFRRAKVARSGRVRYRLTREIIPPVTTSNGVWFNVGLVWGRDPATLHPDTATGDEAVAPLFRGFRITHANRNTVSPTASDKIRLRTYPSRTDIQPREAQVIARFAQGVPHTMEMTWTTTGVVTLYDRTLGVRQSFASSSALVLPTGGAWLMWYASFGSGFLLEEVAVS